MKFIHSIETVHYVVISCSFVENILSCIEDESNVSQLLENGKLLFIKDKNDECHDILFDSEDCENDEHVEMMELPVNQQDLDELKTYAEEGDIVALVYEDSIGNAMQIVHNIMKLPIFTLCKPQNILSFQHCELSSGSNILIVSYDTA